MAVKYAYSGAAGAATGADWANAYLTLSAGVAGIAAGDTLYVANDHAETQGSAMALNGTGTAASPCSVICVNRSGTVPPVSADLRTTATVTTTGNFAITFNGSSTYYYGITFSSGSGANSVAMTVSNFGQFDSCSLQLGGTTGGTLTIGGPNTFTLLNNTTVKFASVSSVIAAGKLVWRNTASATLGSVPTSLFTNNDRGISVVCEGVDLSAIGSGKTLVIAGTASAGYLFKDCKLGSSVTIAGTPTTNFPEILVIRSDSAATNYRSEKYHYRGTETTETTIVRTPGATDGTTPQSRKIVTTANSKWQFPFECLPIVFWNETVGSITVVLEGIWGGGAVPNNDDIWMDVEYLGSASFPTGSFQSGTKADILATGSALSAGTGTWGGSTTQFQLSSTFAPSQRGPVTLYVRAAKASSTFYIDPRPTGVKLRKGYALAPGVNVNELSLARGGLHPIEEGIAA